MTKFEEYEEWKRKRKREKEENKKLPLEDRIKLEKLDAEHEKKLWEEITKEWIEKDEIKRIKEANKPKGIRTTEEIAEEERSEGEGE